MTLTIDLLGQQHIILPCTLEDIKPHFAKIQEAIPKEEVKDFKDRMALSVSTKGAFKLSDNSCFLYYRNHKPCCATGVALYGKNEPLKMLALFAGIFNKLDTHTFKMDFHLHPGKFVQEYKSILTATSVRRQLIPGYPLVIRIDIVKKKINALYKKKGISWEQ